MTPTRRTSAPTRRVVRAAGHDVVLLTWDEAGDHEHDDDAGPERPTVLLVHGIGMSHRYLRPLARALAPHARVHAPDLPGHGSSPRPSSMLSIAEHARVVGAVLDQVADGTRPVVVGHSMGAQVVIELVATRPGVASRVVLMGPVVEPGARSLVRQAFRMARDVLVEPWGATGTMAVDWLRHGPVRFTAQARQMLAYRTEDGLRRVVDPVVLVRGDRDPVAPVGYLHALAALPADATVREVAGAAHALMVRRPDAVADLCLRGAPSAGVPAAGEAARGVVP